MILTQALKNESYPIDIDSRKYPYCGIPPYNVQFKLKKILQKDINYIVYNQVAEGAVISAPLDLRLALLDNL